MTYFPILVWLAGMMVLSGALWAHRDEHGEDATVALLVWAAYVVLFVGLALLNVRA